MSPRMQRLRPSVPAVIALGANLGDREAALRSAVDALTASDGVIVTAVSPFVESAAVRVDGVDEDAPRYLNAVVLVDTVLSPSNLLALAHRIEDAHGRVRAERWGDRTLDVDLVDVGGRRSADEELTLPHPRAAERAFVLVPWDLVDPDAVLPGVGPVHPLAASVRDAVTIGAAG